MYKLYAAAIAAFLFSSAAKADDTFYLQQSGKWRVMGVETSPSQGQSSITVCAAISTWDDGSTAAVVQDQSDMELIFELDLKGWNVRNEEGSAKTVFTRFRTQETSALDGIYQRIAPATVQFRSLHYKRFLENFSENDEIFVLLDDGHNVRVELNGSRDAVRFIAQCNAVAQAR